MEETYRTFAEDMKDRIHEYHLNIHNALQITDPTRSVDVIPVWTVTDKEEIVVPSQVVKEQDEVITEKSAQWFGINLGNRTHRTFNLLQGISKVVHNIKSYEKE